MKTRTINGLIELSAEDGLFITNGLVVVKTAFPVADVSLWSDTDTDKLPDTEGYENLVNDLIRQRYSYSNELAILRQRDNKPSEFEEYNAYCEECKSRAKSGGEETINEEEII